MACKLAYILKDLKRKFFKYRTCVCLEDHLPYQDVDYKIMQRKWDEIWWDNHQERDELKTANK